MGQIREVDAISESDLSDAIIATEREIAGEAWGQEDTDPADETGDRTLESIGEGLEGQHEAEDDDAGSEEQEGEESEGEEGDEDGEQNAAEAAGKDKTGEGEESQVRQGSEQQPQGLVPSGKLREANERARALQAERDQLKQQIEAGKSNPELETLKTQVATLTQLLQGQRQGPQPPAKTEQDKQPSPDLSEIIFENPKGFVDQLQQGFETKLNGVMNTMRNMVVSNSFELAHVRHGEAFDTAMAAINKLDPNNPEDRSTVQRIYNSPNPGEQLVAWHKRNATLAEVGPDPVAYKERIRNETRQALLNDPEFKKEILASLRGEAQTGNNGSPRTTNRLPPSLSRAPGASPRAERVDQSAFDGSEQAVADAAWR